MFKEEYIFFNLDANTKTEALEFISNQASLLGLTDDKDGLLEDFLKREEEFSTGLQDGFAIPHAKSSHAKEIGIIYVTCKNPITEWETLDGSPVTNLFALIVPKKNAGNEHLMMISKLATNLLENDFKNTIKSSDNKSMLAEFILNMIKEEN
ncbi:PTS sugar transporter subunit IIA [uncultured Eubacterium sp.]|uniref:PTS sugar transporter subunit IIA n=1 Tax=uncultured Eubacterium sp. TaxID=165185 RepID=UPI002674106B|nr:PTS sugar transporter subunit IIA [uncultured Eubacterium sp.]